MAGGPDTSNGQAFRWIRTVAIAISILLFAYAGFATWTNFRDPPGVDYVSFWAAGYLALEGRPELAYDLVAHRGAEQLGGKLEGLLPFPYPPPYLLLVTPFAFLPFWAAFPLWVGSLLALFFFTFRRFVPAPYLFAHPALLANALVGQNGMLTASILYGGASLLQRREWLAGAALGCMVIKPQLALLIPIALLAGQYWRAIGGAALSALLLLALAFILFGADTYRAFFALLPEQAALLSGRIPWHKVASTYGALRAMGVPAGTALACHVALALVAAVATWLAWSRHYDTRVPLLAAATLLISPYLFIYDSVLMLVPIAWLIVRQRRPLVIVSLWAVSAIALFTQLPDPTFIAAACALFVMWREARIQPAEARRLRPESGGDR